MARKEDLLFCKIAISHGMVTQAQAQKVLAHVDKRHEESGRRPRIGTVFAKANLIDGDQVRTIYEAVQKRTGGGGGSARAGAPVRRGGRGNRAGQTAGRRGRRGREAPSRREVDPQTLWMGIGFGVVFLAVIVIILFLFIRQNMRPDPSLAESSRTTPATEVARVATPTPAPATSAGGGAESAAPRAGGQVLSQERRHDLQQMLGDIRRDVGEDPRRGRELLARLKADLEDLASGGYSVAEFTVVVDELSREIEDALAALPNEEPDTAPDEVVSDVEGTPEPVEEETVAPPEPRSDESSDDAEDDAVSLDDFFDE